MLFKDTETISIMKSKVVFRKDNLQTKALVKAGKIASETANRAARALGISVTYIRDGIIYEESSEGEVIVKRHMEEDINAPFEVKKGLVLHAK